jgi:hypothetical protein
MKQAFLPWREMMSEKKQPTPDEVLTASLKLIVDEFVDMGYDEKIIFGKVNLILQKFITNEGGFTDEYIQLAREAMARKESEAIRAKLLNPEGRPQNDGTGIGLIVPGGGVGGITKL